MSRILLIRHGQASFGKANYDALSDLGHQQAQQLGEYLHQCNLIADTSVCGSMQRHAETAENCLQAMQQPTDWAVDAGFNEYDHEEVIVRYKPEYADKAKMMADLAKADHPHRYFQQMFAEAIQRWVGGQHNDDYTETWAAFRQRCWQSLIDFQHQLTTMGTSKTGLVFTSGGAITAITQQLLHTPDEHIFAINWSLVNAAITKLLYSPNASLDHPLTLSSLNDYSHFERLGDDYITYR